jgi:D-threo-aldose 1-dehydrogenase
MDPLHVRTLGRTGVGLTALGFGSAPLGELFVAVSDEDSRATMQAAWDAGVRYYDSAPWYGRGLAEHRVGEALYRKPRGAFVLSTKVGRVMHAPPDPDNWKGEFWAGGLRYPHVFDYSYDGVMRAFDQSLQRLRLNRVDLLLIHDLDFMHHKSETGVQAFMGQLVTGGFRALEQLRASGAIRGIGAGINEMGMVPRFLDLFDIDFFLIAMPYTLLDQEPLTADLPYCERRGVGVVIGAVFASGILATGAVPGAKYRYADAAPEVLERVRRMAAVCARHKVPLAAAALQFPFGHPCVASVIPGAFTPAQVQQNVATMRHPIPADLWAELKSERLIRADAPVPTA